MERSPRAKAGNMGSISQNTEQGSLCATTTEARTPRAYAPQQEKPQQWEAHAPQLESSSWTPQLEKAHMQ